jgi:ABC-type transporter MlaC component
MDEPMTKQRTANMDYVVQQLRKMKLPVTWDKYADIAFLGKRYRQLSPEEKLAVREAVAEANVQ